MKLSKELLNELQNRLKVGNRRGVHLNAIPGRSRYKFDLHNLSHIDKTLPAKFITALLSELPLKFSISWKDNVPDLNSLFEDDQAQLVKINRSLENLTNQTEAIESEKGINTFGFGYPLLVRRDQADNKLTVAPVLIWSLRIKRTKEYNTWEIKRTAEDPIYINEVLINHLQTDAKVEINQIPSEMMEDDLINQEELLQICADLIRSINTQGREDLYSAFRVKLDNVKRIPDKSFFEKLVADSSNSLIHFGGLFSIFEVQKQNVISDYDNLLDLEGAEIDLEDLEEHYFQPLSSVETDPSQQSILHALESTRNILIQGPPGTGKSQSLTAILINALENRKKTIVVCEKRTALEVLYDALARRGLKNHCVLIKDLVKDRRTVVDAVREKTDSSSYHKYRYSHSRETLDHAIGKARMIIDSINDKHKKLDEKLLGGKNWTDIVGQLLAELKCSDEDHNLDLDTNHFKFDSEEMNRYLQVLQEGQKLFSDYTVHKDRSFINPAKLSGDNPFELEKKIKEDFSWYEKRFYGNQSPIRKILDQQKGNPDLFNSQKTSGLLFKITSVFSRSKKRLIEDQKYLYDACIELKTQINRDQWPQKTITRTDSQGIIREIEALLKNSNDYFSYENSLFINEFRWYRYYSSLSAVERMLIDRLKLAKDWKRVLLIYYLDNLLTKSASINLPTSDDEHNELEQTLTDVGKEQIRFINQYWYSQQIDATRNFGVQHSGLSVENLYNKRSSHKHKRQSLRQIVNYDTDLFTTFFPVILTTPDVCSNLFKSRDKYFDIVLFDEASQLRLEDNLPALLKGKQIIIAGDEHQMPPSNYFSKIFDGTVEDEDDIEEEIDYLNKEDFLLSCESLLEFATELNFEKKYLDFHYRSKHPYLIDFSNHAFYNKRLKPLPSEFDYNPINYIHVDGIYSDHSNEREAETVLSIIEHNIHRFPNGKYPTIGVATFNVAQRNLIKSKILERQKFKRYAEFNHKMTELEENGFFVKNLENIQGDERDVIILSTTYGENKDGKFTQRFGPINHKKGYKLLNVIITRAKYKVYVCSSIPEDVISSYKDHLITEGANNRRAVFFAYLAYARAVSDNNEEARQAVLNQLSEFSNDSSSIDILNADLESPFEEEVYYELAKQFGEERLVTQCKFAGFRIDIVYHSKKEGIPKIAIECDGASYHSSKEAYLYDYHRQKILENHGFVFHRIWSTNWWRNSAHETRKLIDFIKNIEATDTTRNSQEKKTDEAFTDKVNLIGSNISTIPKSQYDNESKEPKNNNGIEDSVQTALFKNTVKVNSKVKVKYLNNGKTLKVQLVDKPNPHFDKITGIQEINIKHQLAVSIVGKSVGDTSKVGNLDNYVEIIEIMN